MRRFGLAVILLAGCGQSSTPQTNAACAYDTAADITQVLLDYYSFIPHCFKVTTGTEVTFLNLDPVPHEVQTDDGQVETFDSGKIPAGSVYRHVFGVEGDVALHCAIFPIMKATAFVRTP